jgi:hypothetical protein
LTALDVSGVVSEAILFSGPESWILRGRYPTNPYEAPSFRALAADTGGRYPLALALGGTFPSYFAGKPAPVRGGAPPGRPAAGTAEKKDRSEETRLIVLGDADAARDVLLRVSDSAYNTVFFENAADWLSGADSLMTIRARSVRDMRLNKIEDRAARDGLILFSEIINLVGLPLIIAGAGFLRYLRRRERHDL